MMFPPVVAIFPLLTTGVTIYENVDSDYEFLEVPLINATNTINTKN
jgi:hypothetical protein